MARGDGVQEAEEVQNEQARNVAADWIWFCGFICSDVRVVGNVQLYGTTGCGLDSAWVEFNRNRIANVARDSWCGIVADRENNPTKCGNNADDSIHECAKFVPDSANGHSAISIDTGPDYYHENSKRDYTDSN